MSRHYDWSVRRRLPARESHSAIKHALLEAYLERYFQILTSNPKHDIPRFTIVDGFAGGGQYRCVDTKKICNGSPVIFLETIARIERRIRRKRNKKCNFDVVYYFVDENAGAIAKLQSVLKEKGYGDKINKSIHLLHGTFAELAPAIIAMTKQRKGRALFLLDQYGYKDVPITVIRRITRALPNAELLLTFNIDTLLNYLTNTKGFQKCVENFDPKMQLLSCADLREAKRLKSLHPRTGRQAKWRLFIEKKLLNGFKKHSGAQFCTPYIITPKQSQRAYWFIHFSNHIKARDEMVKLQWKQHNHFRYNREAAVYMLEHNSRLTKCNTDKDSERCIVNAIKKSTARIVARNKKGITLKSLLERQTTYYPAHARIVKKAIMELQQANKLVIIDSMSGKQSPSMSGWNDVLCWKSI